MAKPKKEEIIIPSEEVQDDLAVEKEEKEENRSEKLEVVNEVFKDLERCMLHGSAEQMNDQQNELLSAKIKIKRLI